MRGIASLGIAALLSACAAAPSAYYSLSAPTPTLAPSAVPAASGRAAADFGLRVEAVGIPAEVDRPQLVVRREAADAGVALLNGSLWAAPLSDQLRAVLAARISRALGVPDVSVMAAPQGLQLREVAVQVTRFDLVYGQYAGLEANWTESRPRQAMRLCHAALRVPVAAGVPALVEGQREAVGLLAQMIAAHMDSSVAVPHDPAILSNRCT
ncbi:PqiC family protein [Castellaniella sp. GW247-6E4]|uniref:PqiC family protein n=1 Tax=Castellaniella sp. GW247-6E4 TaxID=3140380 RepID=UPI003315C1F6